MTQPRPTTSGPSSSSTKPTTTAAPPDPRVQAMTFALQLAELNADTLPKSKTPAGAVVADADTILAFLKKTS